MTHSFVKPEFFSLKNHPEFNEKWIQERIAEDPMILGLGDLILKDKERLQPGAGRLDLLLQDLETDRRYEVEIQLAGTDPSHIIRTIEYWDIERKRYPQYDHCAVIVAEDITSRFLNVINLFNGFIPLIAIQMKAIRLGDNVSLLFTKVMDELTLGPVDDEDTDTSGADRRYWETKVATAILSMADRLLQMIKTFAPETELKYNKEFIGLARNGQPDHFVLFRPRKNFLILETRLDQHEEVGREIEDAGLDSMGYYKSSRRFRVRLRPQDVEEHGHLLERLMRMAHEVGES